MKRTLIIAEAGVNHNGDIAKAKALIDKGAEAGVDYVKFQTFKAGNLVTKQAKRAAYQDKNTQDNDSQYEMLKKLELSQKDHQELIDYCAQKGVQFLSTGFDFESLEFLAGLGITIAKVPSGEITNLPYLRKVATLFPEVILSTGMANITEIKDAVKVLTDNGVSKNRITVLHCNTEYPTPMEDVNLKAMLHIQQEVGVNIGYSDHTLGIEVPIAAVALGATVIEKHFTLDKTLPGPDHKASLEPEELKAMVSAIRNIEKAVGGSGIKEVSASEAKNKPIVRKSIVAAKKIAKGEPFTVENLTVKRPGTGISPMQWDEVIGKTAKKDFEEDDLIEL
ncbi:N-acetylneuraminate synthase [Capnocytophaga sp. oral taxon 412 str. F0487]|uniref:N-acetylneuraminate synthase n=1 Tax=Capnocytophaga sp. oral taxon 412 TaxID=712218 RepID=UPI00026964F6|nr:N-acetylneuraminate synthase [Capnocytophaga sp. oral taxon 412]EIW91139.1 N-acetylneuraminate synthase [Capnocytophaga sp. oral taxon 412 str. F0487]